MCECVFLSFAFLKAQLFCEWFRLMDFEIGVHQMAFIRSWHTKRDRWIEWTFGCELKDPNGWLHALNFMTHTHTLPHSLSHAHTIDYVTDNEKQTKHIIFLYPHVQLISNVTRVFSVLHSVFSKFLSLSLLLFLSLVCAFFACYWLQRFYVLLKMSPFYRY